MIYEEDLETGISSGKLPSDGLDIRVNASVGPAGLGARYDPISNTGTLEAKINSGPLSVRAGINTNLERTARVGPGMSFGAEVSATGNGRFAFKFRQGQVGDWIFDNFYKSRNEEYLRNLIEANFLINNRPSYPTTSFGDLMSNPPSKVK